MSKLELSDQANRLIKHEIEQVETETAALAGKLTTAASVLSAACKLMNLRGRYFAQAGEHFSVQEYEGIAIVDALDEALLKALRRLLKGYIDHVKRVPATRVMELLTDKLTPALKELPQYPVGYMILFVVRSAFDSFQAITEEPHGFELAEMESGFVHYLLGAVDKYVGTREKPVVRHFSDVAREYSVVSRLRCKCGEEKFEVKQQSLQHLPDQAPFDRLDLQCKKCGHQRSITFDLPHFKDMYEV